MAQLAPILASKAFLGATAAVSAIGTGASIHQQRQAQRSAEKADKAGEAAANIQNQRAQRRQILQARVLQAQATSAGVASGGSFSDSGARGAVSALGATAGGNIGAANTQIGAQNAINSQLSQARGFASRAQTFGQVAALPSQFGFDTASVFKELRDKSVV